MRSADITVSTAGPFYKYGVKVIKAAIAAGTNFVDIMDDYNSTAEALSLSSEAERAAVISAVASPELTNIFAMHGVNKLEEVDEIHTFWCESAVDPTGPAAVFHWLNAIHGNIPTYRGGKWVDVPAMSEPETVSFPLPINGIELYHVGHPEPLTLPRYVKGVQVVTNKGAIYPLGMSELYKALSMAGFGSDREFIVRKDVSMPLRELSTRLVRAMPHFAPDMFKKLAAEANERYGDIGSVFKAVVKGKARGEVREYSYETVSTTTPLVTAVPAAIATLMVLRGDVTVKGVHAPEGALDPAVFLNDFKGNNLTVIETEKVIREI